MIKFWNIALLLLLVSCTKSENLYEVVRITESKESQESNRQSTIEDLNIKLAEGLTVNLWATDSLAPDPIAMSIDNQGRIYLTRTNRQKNSEFDIRAHRDWMTASISFQSVEDRRDFLKKTFSLENSDQNKWLKDLNGDSIHDWRDLTVEKEEVWRLEDVDNDGMADISERIVNDFSTEVTDVAGALLVDGDNIFIGVGPDLWKLTDTDGDGIAEKKESLIHGFAVHIGFGGHGMSGLIKGPDGKIYWGIGDIGVNIKTKEGQHFKYPNRGVIVRCNADGSDFEVFAHGYRNTHEFVFDDFGNLISVDNDGDYPGESERLVHIVEGADAGWRTNWQFGKYTDRKNNNYNVWLDENMHKPRQEEQAAYFLPPLKNYHNGPAGMVHNPGSALGSKWQDNFFMVEFVGNPSRSHVWSFKLKQKGATFEFEDETDVISGILPTAIKFGNDGALYVADWVMGWDTKNFGRVWKIDVTPDEDDLKELQEITKKHIESDFNQYSEEQLFNLLGFSDRRVRLKAQFKLVERGNEGFEWLKKAANSHEDKLGRIHGIWGMGQLLNVNPKWSESLYSLLSDQDDEIVTQSARVLGDARDKGATTKLKPLILHNSPRIRFYSTQALGRIGEKSAVPEILKMLKQNNGEDLYLRHAGVLALSRIGDEEKIVELINNENRELRIVSVLVLRRWSDPRVSRFLFDTDPYIIAEAARAINDDWSIEQALPDLAEFLDRDTIHQEVITRRSINANLRVGDKKSLNRLIGYVKRKDIPNDLKAEAIETLSTWNAPSLHDRVDGRYRGKIEREKEPVVTKVSEIIPLLLNQENNEVKIATVNMIGRLELNTFYNDLEELFQSSENSPLKVRIIRTLSEKEYSNLKSLFNQAYRDTSEEVRSEAISLIGNVELSVADLQSFVDAILDRGSLVEKQNLIRALNNLDKEFTEPIADDLLSKFEQGKIEDGLQLELSEMLDNIESGPVKERWNNVKENLDPTEMFNMTLEGGDRRAGRRYFYSNPTGQCTRCHSMDKDPNSVGPPLGNIGSLLSREEILESLIKPNTRIAPGYGSVKITLDDGQSVSGILMEETEDEVHLQTVNAEPLVVEKARIKERQNMPSAMPPQGLIMTKKELRDLIEYLSGLQNEPN